MPATRCPRRCASGGFDSSVAGSQHYGVLVDVRGRLQLRPRAPPQANVLHSRGCTPRRWYLGRHSSTRDHPSHPPGQLDRRFLGRCFYSSPPSQCRRLCTDPLIHLGELAPVTHRADDSDLIRHAFRYVAHPLFWEPAFRTASPCRALRRA